MTRIKDWKVEDLTEEQKEIHDAIVSGPRAVSYTHLTLPTIYSV